MEGRLKVRVIRGWEDRKARIPREPVLVEVPRQWAQAVISLVRISEEFRHNGLIVTNVGPGSQAATAGIARGDVLLRYEGVELDSTGTLKHLTKRHTQGAGLSKTITIQAVRGSEDVNFEVQGGHLGITVSPSLHRLKRVSASRKPTAGSKHAGVVGSMLALFHRFVAHTADESKRHVSGKLALVEVHGEIARTVLFLVRTLELSGASKPKKMARSLLLTAGAKLDRP